MKFISISFGKWRSAGFGYPNYYYFEKRIYIKKYIWTPFIVCELKFRKNVSGNN